MPDVPATQASSAKGLTAESAETTQQRSFRGISTPRMHLGTQKSATLRRKYVARPNSHATAAAKETPTAIVRNHSPMTSNSLTAKQAAAVNKFNSNINPSPTRKADRPAEAHPVAQRATRQALDISSPRQQRNTSARNLDSQFSIQQPQERTLGTPKPAGILKNEAISKAMSKEMNSHSRSQRKTQKTARRWPKIMTVATSSLAVVMLAGYFTYLSMPNLSIRVAAVQSGVNAKYPGYRPDGYALNGPITFTDGEVRMRFAYVDGNHGFTVTQQKSNLSSSAIKQQLDETSESVMTTTTNGLTIYSHDGRTTWVNSGILYTIEGDAALSNSQLQRIATSL